MKSYTTCSDAYLTPVIMRYIESFSKGFDSNFKNVPVLFMQSDGGLSTVERFSGHKAILSGPAGGVVGYGTHLDRRVWSLNLLATHLLFFPDHHSIHRLWPEGQEASDRIRYGRNFDRCLKVLWGVWACVWDWVGRDHHPGSTAWDPHRGSRRSLSPSKPAA